MQRETCHASKDIVIILGFLNAKIYYTRDDATASKRAKFYIDSLLCNSGQLRGFTSLRKAREKNQRQPQWMRKSCQA